MKIAGSYSAMYCTVIIIYYVTVVFVTTTWAGCEIDTKAGIHGCRVHERVYPIYKKLESIMVNDTEILYQMKEAFFPTLVRQSWESRATKAVHIRVCGMVNETSEPPSTCNGFDNNLVKTRCWNLRWSRSPGLNMIDVGQLLAFDPTFPDAIYSPIVGSSRRRSYFFAFHITSDLFPCTPSESDLTQAIVLLSSWGKAYAKAQGVPTTWSQEDQGYIARWYNFYTVEGYETERVRPAIRKLLLVIFILLNLFVLHTNITLGRKWYYNFFSSLKENSDQATRIYLTAGLTMASFNFLYLTATVVLYTKYNSPPICRAECTALAESACSPPHNSTLYKDEVTSFIVKVVVILTAIIISLLVAIKTTLKSTLPTATPCSKCLRIMLLWNYLVFVQIWTGLISLPFSVFLIISPLQTISTVCAAVLGIALIAVSVLCLLQLGDIQIRTCNNKTNGKVCTHFSRCLLLLPLSATSFTLYMCLSPSTNELSGIKIVLYTLLPPILLSVIAWVVKRRFLNKNMEKQKIAKQLSVGSMSTEQEYLQDMEKNGNLVESDEEYTSLLTEQLLNSGKSHIV